MGPAQISGGWSKDWRTRALVFSSPAMETRCRDSAAIDSAPVQSVLICPVPRSTVAMPLPPSTCSVKRMRPDGSQVSQQGEALMSGVKLRGVPPVAASVKMSPPMTPSSLIRPPMKAIALPSGDQHGTAICMDVFRIDFISPDATASV